MQELGTSRRGAGRSAAGLTEMNRRGLLAGGALSALGIAGLASPRKAWSWSPSGSLDGTGDGRDPRWVWDDEADPIVAAVIDRGQVPAVNALLRKWTTNSQPLPKGLPADLRHFMHEARQLPAWADRHKLAAAVEFNKKRGNYLGMLYGLCSGMMSTAIPHEARAVYYSKGGAAMKDRISKTAKLGYDVGSLNAFQPSGQMIVTAVKTRLVHAAVRHLLPQSPGWKSDADEKVPISQNDILITWHSLATTAMQHLNAWNVSSPAAESDGFLHSWQVTAHLLGVRDEYIPATWQDANTQAHQVLDPVLGPSTEGVELAKILLEMVAQADGGLSQPFIKAMSRYLVGDRVADWLQLSDDKNWDAFVQNGWPAYVNFREALLPLPLAPDGYWTFDELLRQAVLFFLSDGKQISIEIPDTNRVGSPGV